MWLGFFLENNNDCIYRKWYLYCVFSIVQSTCVLMKMLMIKDQTDKNWVGSVSLLDSNRNDDFVCVQSIG